MQEPRLVEPDFFGTRPCTEITLSWGIDESRINGPRMGIQT